MKSTSAKQLLRDIVHKAGRDVVEYPMSDWRLLQNELQQLFETFHINCVIDVGANDGEYARFLRNMGFRGRIVSFEPVTDTFHRLRANAGKDCDWHTHRCALGEENGIVEINVTGASEFCSFLPSNEFCLDTFGSKGTIVRKEPVEVRRLDSLAAEVTAGLAAPRIHLKLDTQGWDLQVLAGASRMLDQICTLQSEMSVRAIYSGMTGYVDALAALTNMGFTLAGIAPVSRGADRALIEFDCVMVRTPGAT